MDSGASGQRLVGADPGVSQSPARLLHGWRNRYTVTGALDPATGRFLTRDPIGVEGGVNLYATVGNGVVNKVDSDGLWEIILPRIHLPDGTCIGACLSDPRCKPPKQGRSQDRLLTNLPGVHHETYTFAIRPQPAPEAPCWPERWATVPVPWLRSLT